MQVLQAVKKASSMASVSASVSVDLIKATVISLKLAALEKLSSINCSMES